MVIRQAPFFYETKEYGVWEFIREFNRDEFALEALERQTQAYCSEMRNWDYENDYPGIPYHHKYWVDVHESIYPWFNPDV